MHVYILNRQNTLTLEERDVSSVVLHVLECEELNYDEVSVHLVSEEEICRIHAKHFDDPSPTDCMSFPIDSPDKPGYKNLGDIFVCTDTAVTYSRYAGADPYTETTLYIVHALLHLAGYDDLSEADQTEMRSAEERRLSSLRKNGLLLAPPTQRNR